MPPKKANPPESDAEPIEPASPHTLPALTDFHPQALLDLAIREKSPVDALEKLLLMIERMDAKRAERAFYDALAQFQAACPVIGKADTATDKYNKPRYSYSSMDTVKVAIQPHLLAAGLAYRFEYDCQSDHVKALCIVTHRDGHTVSTPAILPIDKDAYMNVQQQVGSACSYAARYSLIGALGLVCGGEDNDANPPTRQPAAQPAARQAAPSTASTPPKAATGQQAPTASTQAVRGTGPIHRSDGLLEDTGVVDFGKEGQYGWSIRINGVYMDIGNKCGDYWDMALESKRLGVPVRYLYQPKKNPKYFELVKMKWDDAIKPAEPPPQTKASGGDYGEGENPDEYPPADDLNLPF